MRRNVVVAVLLVILIVGLGTGVYFSQKNYIPLLSELRSQIELKNQEIRKLKEQQAAVIPVTYVVTSGKVYPMGSSSAVLQKIELTNGGELQINGVVIRNNGTTLRLGNGDMITSDGIIMLSTSSAK